MIVIERHGSLVVLESKCTKKCLVVIKNKNAWSGIDTAFKKYRHIL